MPKFNVRTPNARRSIPASPKLHIAPQPTPGLAVGYRKSASLGGVWFARKYREGTKQYDSYRIGLADDANEANNATFFSYEQAAQKAQEWFQQETGAIVVNKAYTVRNLMDDYLADQELTKRKSLLTMKQRIKNTILPTLGEIPLRKLTHPQVENWFHNLAKSLPRTRGCQNKVAYREVADLDDEEYRRKRQASANTVWNILRAALNYGYKQHKVANRAAWDKINRSKP